MTEPKPHQKSSKASAVSNGSETSGELTADTETNSMENSVESDTNYTNFEHTLNEMIVDSDSLLQSQSDRTDNGAQNGDADHSPGQSNSNSKRVKLDIHSDVSVDTNDILMENKSCDNNLHSSGDQSKGRSECRSGPDTELNKETTNSCGHNCSYGLNEQNSTLGSLLSNPGLNLLLSPTNATQRCSLSPDPISAVPLVPSVAAMQTYDIMICGNCRTLFTSVALFVQHKRLSKCRLRFVCRCQSKWTVYLFNVLTLAMMDDIRHNFNYFLIAKKTNFSYK